MNAAHPVPELKEGSADRCRGALLALLVCAAAAAQPAPAPRLGVVLDGRPLSAHALLTPAGAVLLPLRDLVPALAARVEWFPDERKVELRRGEQLVELWIMTPVAQVDRSPVQLTSPPLMRNGVTYLPLRLLAEAFGWEVDWVPAARQVTLTTAPAAPPPAPAAP